MRFTYADPSNCASLEAESETQTPTANGVRICADGSFTAEHASGGQSDSQPLASSNQFAVTMTVKQQQMSLTVNGRLLFADAPYTGPTEFLLIGATRSPLDVSNFSLTPSAL